MYGLSINLKVLCIYIYIHTYYTYINVCVTIMYNIKYIYLNFFHKFFALIQGLRKTPAMLKKHLYIWSFYGRLCFIFSNDFAIFVSKKFRSFFLLWNFLPYRKALKLISFYSPQIKLGAEHAQEFCVFMSSYCQES